MNTYKISYTLEHWYSVEVQADNEEQAKELFWRADFDQSSEKLTGLEIQDSIDIERIA